jgi:hypothetical protein
MIKLHRGTSSFVSAGKLGFFIKSTLIALVASISTSGSAEPTLTLEPGFVVERIIKMDGSVVAAWCADQSVLAVRIEQGLVRAFDIERGTTEDFKYNSPRHFSQLYCHYGQRLLLAPQSFPVVLAQLSLTSAGPKRYPRVRWLNTTGSPEFGNIWIADPDMNPNIAWFSDSSTLMALSGKRCGIDLAIKGGSYTTQASEDGFLILARDTRIDLLHYDKCQLQHLFDLPDRDQYVKSIIRSKSGMVICTEAVTDEPYEGRAHIFNARGQLERTYENISTCDSSSVNHDALTAAEQIEGPSGNSWLAGVRFRDFADSENIYLISPNGRTLIGRIKNNGHVSSRSKISANGKYIAIVMTEALVLGDPKTLKSSIFIILTSTEEGRRIRK